MAIKYISQNKDKNWKVSNTKTGKAIKIMKTQKEAIAYAATINNTEAILIKRSSGWKTESSWDKEVAKKAVKLEEKNKARGMSDSKAKTKAAEVAAGAKTATKTPAAKKPVVKKTTTAKKPVAKKASAKKTTTAKKPVAKKAPAKKTTTAKKAPAKKTSTTKKPVVAVKPTTTKPTTAKKPATKKATTAPKKVQPMVKPAVKEEKANNDSTALLGNKSEFSTQNVKIPKETKDPNKLSGFLGFVLGLSLIAIFISGAFLLGYFL